MRLFLTTRKDRLQELQQQFVAGILISSSRRCQMFRRDGWKRKHGTLVKLWTFFSLHYYCYHCYSSNVIFCRMHVASHSVDAWSAQWKCLVKGGEKCARSAQIGCFFVCLFDLLLFLMSLPQTTNNKAPDPFSCFYQPGLEIKCQSALSKLLRGLNIPPIPACERIDGGAFIVLILTVICFYNEPVGFKTAASFEDVKLQQHKGW